MPEDILAGTPDQEALLCMTARHGPVIGGVGQPLSGVFRIEDIYKDPQENRVYVGGTFNYKDARDGNTIGNGIGIYNPATSSWDAQPI